MATVDPARAQLITQEYRYSIRQDASIKALFPNAREIVLDSALDQAGGDALSQSLFDQTKAFARTFTLTIEGLLYLEDFTDAPPRFVIRFDRHPAAGTNIIYTVLTAKPNFYDNRTVLTVRG